MLLITLRSFQGFSGAWREKPSILRNLENKSRYIKGAGLQAVNIRHLESTD